MSAEYAAGWGWSRFFPVPTPRILTDEERAAAETLFASMKRVDLSRSVAEIAVMERRKQGLKLSDAIILASADSEGCILVTRNTRDYDAHDPRVRFPYSL